MTGQSSTRPRWWQWRRRSEVAPGFGMPSTSRGYVSGTSRLALATNGLESSIVQLAATQPRESLVWGLGDDQWCAAIPVDVSTVGQMSVSTVSLRSGRFLQAPDAQEVLTSTGWITVDGLARGDRVAVVGVDPEPLDVLRTTDEVIEATARALVAGGLSDLPQPVAQAPRDQILRFLRLIWEQAGTVRPGPEHERIYLALPNERASVAVARLLLRFGVDGQISRWGGGFAIKEADSICAFLKAVPPGSDRMLAGLASRFESRPIRECVDAIAWDDVVSVDIGEFAEVWRVETRQAEAVVVNGIFVAAARPTVSPVRGT